MSKDKNGVEAKDELQQIMNFIVALKDSIHNLKKYKGNSYYKKLYESSLKELNRAHIYFKTKLKKANKPALEEKFGTADTTILSIVSNGQSYDEKLREIEELEKFWPELEVEFDNTSLNIRSFEIPEEIPMTDYRLDLEEAVKDFENGCYVSSLVMCRRSYEGALVTFYKEKTGEVPVEQVICKNCKAVIRDKSYKGIAKLHSWAIENSLVTDKLKQVGFLVTDLGAGGAHPPLTEFPRDKEMAKLGITATIALLKQVHSKNAD